MSKKIGSLILVGLPLLAILGACRTTAYSGDAPALITMPTDASHAALQNVVNTALNTEVLIADDALTTSPVLTIERRAPASLQGQAATGRNMEPPIRFLLIINNSACILIDSRDESRHQLKGTTCKAQ